MNNDCPMGALFEDFGKNFFKKPILIMIKKSFIILLSIFIVVAVLSLLFHIPYMYTLIGFSAWVFVGHLVTADDDLPGGWSNPDGKLRFPWGENF